MLKSGIDWNITEQNEGYLIRLFEAPLVGHGVTWLRNYATCRKVAVSVPGEEIPSLNDLMLPAALWL
jgi:hypothetical protein